jgi:hypothetical protein
VLEYFFPKYTRADSLQRMARVLRSPTFDAHDDQDVLRAVSVAADAGNARLSEEDQLIVCLRAIITDRELEEFIDECDLRERLADKRGTLSSKLVTSKSGEDLVAQLGHRIYDIRCRIVHSKGFSQREDGPGLLPGTSDEDLVLYELPLIDFLAGQALAAAASRLDMRTLELDTGSPSPGAT